MAGDTAIDSELSHCTRFAAEVEIMEAADSRTVASEGRDPLVLIGQMAAYLVESGSARPNDAEEAVRCTETVNKSSAVAAFEQAISQLGCSREEMLALWAALACAERASETLLSQSAPREEIAAVVTSQVPNRVPAEAR